MSRPLFPVILTGLALVACVGQKADVDAAAAKPAPTATSSKPSEPAKPVEKPVATPAPKPKGDPLPAKTPAKAPEQFKVEFTTTVGKFTIAVTRAWAPLGADRFHEMVGKGFYKDIAFFRVIDGFMVQFGLHGDPAITAKWKRAAIKDDPVTQSNERGMITYAMAGPNTRTTQMFINFGSNRNLDGMGFAPFGKVTSGMDVVDKIYKVGEGAPRGPGPGQGQIQSQGNVYLKKNFPSLDYILSASFVK